jgi:hypothetical protein
MANAIANLKSSLVRNITFLPQCKLVPTPVAKHFLLGSIGALLGATFVKLSITRKVYQAVLGGQFSFMAGLVAGRKLDALTENMGMKAKVASRSWLLSADC